MLPLDEQEDPEHQAALEESLQGERAIQGEHGAKEVPSLADEEATALEAEINEWLLQEEITQSLFPPLSPEADGRDVTTIE